MEPEAGLAEIARQRARLAARIRLPGWYLVLNALAVAALAALPALTLPVFAYFLIPVAAVLVLGAFSWLLSGRRGVKLATGYPSLTRPAVLQLVVTAAGMIAVVPFALSGATAIALGVALLTGVLAADQLRRQLRAIRHDVRAGRVGAGGH
ncbi:hypothetical protein ACPZ19_10130 [Amycolatopsis lurida]